MDDIKQVQVAFEAQKMQAFHGERARAVMNGADWAWLKQYIFGAMEDQATHTLINARTEESRMQAQQMFLASRKPVSLLEALISQGDAARASLEEHATTLAQHEEEQNA